MGTLFTRGVTPTLYLEMFGGFGRVKDMITWQVAMVMSYMQQENYPAAMDALGLLFVCLKQTAMDNGKMDLGFSSCPGGGPSLHSLQCEVHGGVGESLPFEFPASGFDGSPALDELEKILREPTSRESYW